MGRRANGRLLRCAGCALPPDLCLCDALRPIAARTRVVVLMHASERTKPTNTGRLVPRLLEGGEVRLRGAPGAPLDLVDLADPARRLLVLDPDGVALDAAEDDARPVTLLVPDGTWRQARRIVTREPGLARATRVRLPAGGPTRYRLRDSGAPTRLATLEAVARALGALEGPAAQAHLEAAFDLLVERTLRLRGAVR
ncbi:MAG: DTW domain-containing protein [Planctomycetes bacterium]|nr:DTW domain-containing protein [Planctomycetota bacterium]